jgi:hypothetical protein
MLFPSPTQYNSLKSKISKLGYASLSEHEKVLNRNYNYGYQVVVSKSPWSPDSDPLYDRVMAKQAEDMFRRWRAKPQRGHGAHPVKFIAPPLPDDSIEDLWRELGVSARESRR